MKLLLSSSLASFLATTALSRHHSTSVHEQFQAFQVKFNKHYESHAEEQLRFKIFQENLKKYEEFNSRPGRSSRHGISKFSDMRKDEWLPGRLNDYMFEHTSRKLSELDQPSLNYPEEGQFECPLKFKAAEYEFEEGFESNLDWRNASKNHLGLVADVGPKDQAACGSCYMFSAVATMEGSMCVNGLQDNCAEWSGLSEQQGLDCGSYSAGPGNRSDDKPWYNFLGCGGGFPSNVLQHIYYNGGIMAEDEYTYWSGAEHNISMENPMYVGECMYDPAMSLGVPNRDICGTVNKFGTADKEEMKKAMAKYGPLSIAVYVGDSFVAYTEGIYTAEDAQYDCPANLTGLNHAITAVGYGTDEETGMEYWIVKNSWSADWGDAGYIKMEMGKNVCGVEANIAFVDMAQSTEYVLPTEPPTNAPTDAPTTPASGSQSVFAISAIMCVMKMLI